MRYLWACFFLALALSACSDLSSNNPGPLNDGTNTGTPNREGGPQKSPRQGGPVEPRDSHYPDPSPPEHVELSWSKWGGRDVALVCEKDHIEQLPDDTKAVSLNMVLWYGFGRESRVGDAEIAGLKRLPKLEYLSVGVEIGDEGFRAISGLPALEELSLASFYKVTAERLVMLQKLTTLKQLELHMADGMLDEAALKEFREARPDVKIVR